MIDHGSELEVALLANSRRIDVRQPLAFGWQRDGARDVAVDEAVRREVFAHSVAAVTTTAATVNTFLVDCDYEPKVTCAQSTNHAVSHTRRQTYTQSVIHAVSHTRRQSYTPSVIHAVSHTQSVK